MKTVAKEHAARQAREGRLERFKWENLTLEQQDSLAYAGLSQRLYDSLSLEEKEQYIKCRT
jgi:hypothetical protein